LPTSFVVSRSSLRAEAVGISTRIANFIDEVSKLPAHADKERFVAPANDLLTEAKEVQAQAFIVDIQQTITDLTRIEKDLDLLEYEFKMYKNSLTTTTPAPTTTSACKFKRTTSSFQLSLTIIQQTPIPTSVARSSWFVPKSTEARRKS
jgi:hypothetical protein